MTSFNVIGCSCTKDGISYSHSTCKFSQRYKLYLSIFGDNFDLVGCAESYSDALSKLISLYSQYKASTDFAIKIYMYEKDKTVIYTEKDFTKLDKLFEQLLFD